MTIGPIFDDFCRFYKKTLIMKG